MPTAEKIDAMPVAEVKQDFYTLMSKIVLMYGDNQEDTSEQSELTASLCSSGNSQR